jgi:hypothetical protein
LPDQGNAEKIKSATKLYAEKRALELIGTIHFGGNSQARRALLTSSDVLNTRPLKQLLRLLRR